MNMTVDEAREILQDEIDRLLQTNIDPDCALIKAHKLAIEAIDYVIRNNYRQND